MKNAKSSAFQLLPGPGYVIRGRYELNYVRETKVHGTNLRTTDRHLWFVRYPHSKLNFLGFNFSRFT